MADKKGRLPVLYISLLSCAVFSLLFGLSPNYVFALAVRFLLGLTGDGGAVVKTMVCEMAGDDQVLEAHSMNLVISSWAIATLLSPAIGGALSDPVDQYPNLFSQWQETFPRLTKFLTTYRYFLPNFVGSLLCVAGFFVVRFNLRETLRSVTQQQEQQEQHSTRIESSNPQSKPFSSIVENVTEQSPLISSNCNAMKQSSKKEMMTAATALDFNDSFVLSPEALELAQQLNLQQAIRDSYLYSDDLEGAMMTEETRKSMAMSIYRRSSTTTKRISSDAGPGNHQNDSSTRRIQGTTATTPPKPDNAGSYSDKLKKRIMDMPTMIYLMDQDIRNHLLVYSIGAFIISFHMEAFPLFCLSSQNGLGISEKTIGGIMMASGITHALLQPSLYRFIFQRTGLKGSIQWATTIIVPVFLIIPFSLFLSNGKGTEHLRWTALTFLGIVIGVGRMFTVTFYSSMFVSLNHLVPPEERCTFNSLLTRITGGCKSMAPITAGFFTSWAFTVVPSDGWGAVLLYCTLGVAGVALSTASKLLLGPDELLV
jgi:MFS family permease